MFCVHGRLLIPPPYFLMPDPLVDYLLIPVNPMQQRAKKVFDIVK